MAHGEQGIWNRTKEEPEMTGAIMAAAAASADATPAPVNWANITGSLGGFANADQTISAINVQITLRATISSVVQFNAGGGLTVFVHGDEITGVAIANGNFFEFDVSEGDDVHFQSSVSGGPGGTVSYDVTVTNQSVGGSAIDGFSVSHS
jgi:hypothetical protein